LRSKLRLLIAICCPNFSDEANESGMILPFLFIAPTENMGRGVFSSEAIAADVVIEISPVVVLSAADRALVEKTLLHDYIFEWGKNNKECCMALGYIAMYNHSYSSNCEYEMDFATEIITIRTVRPISPGEELFINYNGDWDNEARVWFDKD